jgi:hypothetical protein
MAPMHALDVKGRCLKGFGDRSDFGGLDEQKNGRRSMKRRISQGQAMRSIFGRSRVTQTVRPCSSLFGSLAWTTSGRSARFQASKPPSSVSADTPS